MVILTEVIGDQDRYGQPTTLSAILPLVDVVAGRCAFEQTEGPVVTGSFDDFGLLSQLFHGDIISVHAHIIATGTSSMLLRVNAYRETFDAGKPTCALVAVCYTTFVAVDEQTKRPRRIPPLLNLSSSDPKSSNSSNTPIPPENYPAQDPITAQQTFKHNRKILSTSDLSHLCSLAESRSSFTILYNHKNAFEVQHHDDTVIRIRKQFLPRHKNVSGVIFGGDILQTLEQAAVACGNRIQRGNVSLQTISIRSLTFLKPVTLYNVLQVEAKVIATSQRVLCVIVRSYLDDNTNMVPCHEGVFHLIPIERDGYETELNTGVRSVWSRGDAHIHDFYRAMALPLTSRVKDAWQLSDDVFPSEREPDSCFASPSKVSESVVEQLSSSDKPIA